VKTKDEKKTAAKPFPPELFVRRDEGANEDEVVFTADPKLFPVVEEDGGEQVIAVYKFDRTIMARKIVEVAEG
jgi:hypothetical protein